jgi:hypothetical protein
MSKIYKNFGVDTTYTEEDGKFLDTSTTGEKVNVVDRDIDIINRYTQTNTDTINGGKTHLRDQVFADFKRSGYTDKLSTFYANTFYDLSKKTNTSPISYYTIVTETQNTFEYKIKDGDGEYQFVTKDTYDADAGAEWDSGDNYRKIKDLVVLQKDKIKFNDDTLAYINSTLPNNVAFKIEKQSTANKFVDPLIRA